MVFSKSFFIISQTLSTHTVMISRKKKYCGSGFPFLPNKESEYVYILTAKHCIYADNFQAKTVPTDLVLFFEKEDGHIIYCLEPEDEIIADDANDPDLAILKIKRSKIEFLIGNLSVTYVVNYSPEHLLDWSFKGFPRFTNIKDNKKSVSDQVRSVLSMTIVIAKSWKLPAERLTVPKIHFLQKMLKVSLEAG